MKRIKTARNLINELMYYDLDIPLFVSFMEDSGRPHKIHTVFRTYQNGKWYTNIVLKQRKRRLK